MEEAVLKQTTDCHFPLPEGKACLDLALVIAFKRKKRKKKKEQLGESFVLVCSVEQGWVS